jgi:hypothetical protein
MKPLTQKETLHRLRSAARRRHLGSAPLTRVHKDRKKEQARTHCRSKDAEA